MDFLSMRIFFVISAYAISLLSFFLYFNQAFNLYQSHYHPISPPSPPSSPSSPSSPNCLISLIGPIIPHQSSQSSLIILYNVSRPPIPPILSNKTKTACFIAFFFKNIWSVTKNSLPLHPLLRTNAVTKQLQSSVKKQKERVL